MTGLEAARLDPPGQDTGAKWGAQVTLPASSRSLQPSADTQPQAGGGVRGRDGKGRQRQGCRCRRPQGSALVGRGAGSGTRRARVGRSALARPRPMTRGSHPGRRRVRGRAQRRSGRRTGRHSASLSLTLAHPHQRSPAETARLRRPGVLGRILQASSTASRAAKPGDLAVGALGPNVFCGSLGSAHSSARAPRTLGVWLEWLRIPGAALRVGPRLRLLPGSRGHSARRAQSRAPTRGVPVCLRHG